MKEFPKKLKPQYRHLFPQIKFNDLLEEWRQKAYEYILTNERDGLALYKDEKYEIVDNRIVECLRLELSKLGWKTSLGYNGSVLFIYDDESEIERYKNVDVLCEEKLE